MTWHTVVAEDDLREGEIADIEVAGKKLALFNVGGEIRASRTAAPPQFPTHSGFLSRAESVTRRITPMQADARIQADIAGETRSSR